MVQRFLKKASYLLTTLCCSGGGNAFSGEFEKKTKTKVPLSPLYKLI